MNPSIGNCSLHCSNKHIRVQMGLGQNIHVLDGLLTKFQTLHLTFSTQHEH